MATWLLDLREFDAVEPYGVRAATFLELSYCGCALPQCFPYLTALEVPHGPLFYCEPGVVDYLFDVLFELYYALAAGP